jgi:sigma-B regulation protein RsbU (phosphoserine phosphatase)
MAASGGPGSSSPDSSLIPPAYLIVQPPSGQEFQLALHPVPFGIGRQADNQLVLRDNRASRQHARIVFEEGSYLIEDLQSRHGTWVNGERIARHILRNSDQIDFGVPDSYRLVFIVNPEGLHQILDHLQVDVKKEDGSGGELGKLRSLVEVARAVQRSLSTREVLTAVVDAALSVTGCERGFLMLRKDPELEVTVARDRHGKSLDPSDLRVPKSVLRRALASRRDLLSMSFDPAEQQGIRPDVTVAALELRSAVCIPLIQIRSGSAEETRVTSALENTVGLIYMDSRAEQADLSAASRELLQTLAMEASTILENARLLEQERAKLRMEDELRIAREIQRGLQPPALPSTGWLRAAGSSLPSTEVGGDYYDMRRISGNVWAAVVADVSGKGVSSALLASLLQGTFLMASGELSHTAPRMSRLNEFLLERTQGEKYATVFYCLIDSAGSLHYVNAGHCAPFLLRHDGQLRKIATNGLPVGMMEGTQFEVEHLQLTPGDKLFIYTDGLTEAEGGDGHFFGVERLKNLLRGSAQLDGKSLHDAVWRAVDEFTEGGAIRDDITTLVIEYAGTPVQQTP